MLYFQLSYLFLRSPEALPASKLLALVRSPESSVTSWLPNVVGSPPPPSNELLDARPLSREVRRGLIPASDALATAAYSLPTERRAAHASAPHAATTL